MERSFGPALVYWYWTWHPLYWLGPVLGGVTAALVYQNILLAPDAPAASTASRSGKQEPRRAGAR